ncbi:MAG: hypothetical protein R6V04_09850 [bacterium]
MEKRTVLCTVMLLLIMTTFIHAQQYQAGISFDIGFPQKEFKENIESKGYGLSGYFGYNFPESPIIIGASAKFLVYGRETRREPLILPVYVDVTTTNSIIMGQFMIRLQPPRGTVLPYIDGLAGFSYLATDTRIKDNDWDDDIASTKIFDDFTFSYGIGYGIQFCVYQNPEVNNFEKDLMGVYIDIGGQYLKGGIAQYLKEGSIEIIDDTVIYDTDESSTDISILKIGVSFAFK